MRRLVERCCGLDVHKDTVTACIRVPDPSGGQRQELRTFSTMTRGLLTLRDWLNALGVTLVTMESTGVYWKPVYYVLEDDFECWLVNARHYRNVPGKKTDTEDAEWLCELAQHGLVRPSFVPPKEIRELRDLTRYRKAQIQERTREVQRLDKVLQDAGIKLSSVASQVMGKSGRAMLDALVSGTTDPEVLAALARGRLRSKIPALRDALLGRFAPRHALIVGHILAHIDFLDEAIDDLSDEVERVIAPFADKVELLDSIPGVDKRIAETLIAEIGVDMGRFPDHHHLASWAGMSPGNNQSGASNAPPRPPRAPSGCGARWWRRPTQPPTTRAPTSQPSTTASGAGEAPRRPPSLSVTPSSSAPTSCFCAASPTKNSAATTSCSADPERPTCAG